MGLLGWFLLTVSVIIGWLCDSFIIGLIFWMLAILCIWLLSSLFQAIKPRSRI